MKQLRILICCESSGTVREAFRALGHDAWSCDLLPADDGSPYHIQGEALDVVTHSGFLFDMIGLHPPCTYLGVSGIHWNDRGRGWEKTHEALQFVKDLIAAAEDQPFYLENPVSIISSKIRKPDQIIQPYQFGDDASKKTCLWLQGLPPLRLDHAARCPGRVVVCNGKNVERWANQTDSGQNRLGPSEDRWKVRSKTYPGIAAAMAAQWSVSLGGV